MQCVQLKISLETSESYMLEKSLVMDHKLCHQEIFQCRYFWITSNEVWIKLFAPLTLVCLGFSKGFSTLMIIRRYKNDFLHFHFPEFISSHWIAFRSIKLRAGGWIPRTFHGVINNNKKIIKFGKYRYPCNGIGKGIRGNTKKNFYFYYPITIIRNLI